MKVASPLGRRGEEEAAKYLKKKGYKILSRNFSKRYGEIDIVALKNNTLVFVEVKTRSSDKFGVPLESITPWKLKTLIRQAMIFKASKKNLPDSLRIDAISVMFQDGSVKVEHVENISGF